MDAAAHEALLWRARTMDDPLKTLFRSRFGLDAETFAPVRAEGSNRKIYRLTAGEASAIGVLNEDVILKGDKPLVVLEKRAESA